MAINLQKLTDRTNKVINLKKTKNLPDKSMVVLCLDISGSMEPLYSRGKVQELVERILPLGIAFDDNKEVDTYIFAVGSKKLSKTITQDNLDGYVDREILAKNSYGGGTNYSPVLKDILNDFSQSKKTGGFLGFGSDKTYEKLKTPVYVLYITDGNNSDRDETISVMKELAKAGIFIQFVGIGNERFEFLQKLDDMTGRVIDNADFFKVTDLSSMSDDDLYNKLLDEYPGFIVEAKNKGLIGG